MYATSSTFPSMVISDAFEAATNGMHNIDAFNNLEKLPDEGTNGHWKNLIYAIQAFYRQDFAGMDIRLGKIPDDSEAACLKKVLYYMAGFLDKSTKLSFHEEKLVKKITEHTRFLKSAAGQLNESIEYGEELFAETASLLIKEIKGKSPEAASRLALWSFRTCQEKDFDDEALSDNILMLFGQAEGLRLIGLSLIESEPDSALICFTRSLIKRVSDQKIEREEAAAYLEVIQALLTACREGDPVLTDISEMVLMLESELNLFFDISTGHPGQSYHDKIDRLISALSDIPQPVKVEIKKKTPAAAEAVQLELF